MSIAIGFIDTAMIPAMSVLTGVLGTMAANIRTTTPIQLIIGEIGQEDGRAPSGTALRGRML